MKLELEKINFKRLMDTRRFLLIFIFLCGLIFLIVFFAVIPQVNNIFGLQQKINQESDKLRQLQTKLSALEDAQTLQLVQNSEVINHAFPSYKPLLELMAGINFIARQSNASIADIKLSPGLISTQSAEAVITGSKKAKPIETGYKSLSVNLKIVGDIDGVNQFLSGIERISPLSNVTRIALSEKRGDTLDTTTYEAELEIVTYYFTQTIKSTVDAALPSVGATEMELIKEISDYAIAEPIKQINIQGGGNVNLFGIEDELQLEAVN